MNTAAAAAAVTDTRVPYKITVIGVKTNEKNVKRVTIAFFFFSLFTAIINRFVH